MLAATILSVAEGFILPFAGQPPSRAMQGKRCSKLATLSSILVAKRINEAVGAALAQYCGSPHESNARSHNRSSDGAENRDQDRVTS